MNIISKLVNSIMNKKAQADKARNRVVLDCLRSLDFGSVEIRQALVGLNRIKVKDLAAADGVSAVTIYSTISGRRTSQKAMELIAQALHLSVEELFPALEPSRSHEKDGRCSGLTETEAAPDRLGKCGGAGGTAIIPPQNEEPQGCTPEAPDRQL